jgi:hypothetical protein
MKDRVLEYVERTGIRDVEKVRQALRRKPGGPVPVSVIREVLGGGGGEDRVDRVDRIDRGERMGKVRAFSLGGLRVSDRKPNEGLKAKFFKLRKGAGYPVNDLADEWGVSAETVRNYGRRLNCLLYVEVEPGEWVHCAAHPDSAGEKLK